MSVHSKAWGTRDSSMCRTTTQRIWTDGKPPRYHSATPEVSSIMRSAPSDVMARQGVHWVWGSSSTAEGRAVALRPPGAGRSDQAVAAGAGWYRDAFFAQFGYDDNGLDMLWQWSRNSRLA